MSKFKIYKASAGSGKTFNLVYEYIKILIQNPTEYKHILAVTFTNDATEEMKSRVLNQLKALSENPEGLKYTEWLKEQLGVDSFHIQKRAAESLKYILHDYSSFNISTIDTFFQKILRAFAKDLGIPAAYDLQLNSELAVQEVTEKVIASSGAQNDQTKWLMQAALENIEEGKSWNIREELKSIFKEIFKENYQEKEEKIRTSFQNSQKIRELQQHIANENKEFENGLKERINACHSILAQHGLSKSSFPYAEASLYNWVIKLENGILDAPGPRFMNALNNVDTWYSKSTDATTKQSILNACESGLNEALNALHNFYCQHLPRYNSNMLIKDNLLYFAMFESLVDEMTAYKSEKDILFITDTNQFISEIIGENEESFIFEKAGNYYHHYLIDEFQDTSQLQWKNFKPLISNAVSNGNTSLVVGDVKQSIYRFRNGDWRLLHEVAGHDITYHEVIPLAENHRSLENVIRFNNTLYNIAPRITADIYQVGLETNNEWPGKFEECYQKQEQKIPEENKNGDGFVKVKLFATQTDAEKEEDNAVITQQLNELVVDISNALKRGYQPKDIAILVFKGSEAFAVATHLREHVEKNGLQDQINIVTQSSLNIYNAHAVRLIIACLRYLVNKRDQVSHANILSEYQLYFSDSNGINISPEEFNKYLGEFTNRSKILGSLPIQILIETIIEVFKLHQNTNEHIFIQHFKDAVFEYLKKNPDDLANFMVWWEESHEKFVVEVPQNERSLQIVTIHKSKGREFNLVFIPFANWSLDSTGNKSDTLWLDTDKDGVKTLPIKYNKKMLQSDFSAEYLETKFYNYLDKLNLLYVATTRAVRELYIYTDRPKTFSKKEPVANIKSIFNLLDDYTCTGDDDIHLQLQNHILEERTEWWVGEKKIFVPENKKQEFESLETHILPGNILDSLAIKRQSTDLRDEDSIKYEELKLTGIIFHQVAEKVNSLEEAKQALNKLLVQRVIDHQSHEGFVKDFERLFDHPDIKHWINDFKTYSEYSICINGEVIKPDKFFMNENEAIVVDFKTGKVLPEYKEQVRNYCKAVAQLFNKPVKGFLYYTKTHELELINE